MLTELKCSSCGSKNVSKISASLARCSSCGTTFICKDEIQNKEDIQVEEQKENQVEVKQKEVHVEQENSQQEDEDIFSNLKTEPNKENDEQSDDEEGSSIVKEIFLGVKIAISGIFVVLVLVFVICFIIGFRPTYVLTSSLEPTIKAGETIVININIDRSNLQVGDIVEFQKGNIMVTHRIIEIKVDENGEKYYIQAPDVIYRRDILHQNISGVGTVDAASEIYQDQIVGKAVMSGENPVKLVIIGGIYHDIKESGARGIIIAVIASVLVLLIIWSVVSELISKNKSKKDKAR